VIEANETVQLQEWAKQSAATFDLQNRIQQATQLMATLEASFGSH
jgi:hypothetical protein